MKLSKNWHISDAQIDAILTQLRTAIESDIITNPPLTWDDIRQALRTLEQPRPEDGRDLSTMQRKRRAAAIRGEIAARVDELRQRGVRNPVTQAEREVAERYQHANGVALNRWLRRNR